MARLNVGNIDRAVRILGGLALVALAAGGAVGAVGAWGYLGVVLMLTGPAARCPGYAMLGFATTSR